MLPIAFSIPDAQAVHIRGFCRGSDGALAVAGWIAGQDLRPKDGFLSLVSPDHSDHPDNAPGTLLPFVGHHRPGRHAVDHGRGNGEWKSQWTRLRSSPRNDQAL